VRERQGELRRGAHEVLRLPVTADAPVATVAIRAATPADADGIWAVLAPVIRGGEHFALARDMTREAALAYWFAPDHDVFVALEGPGGGGGGIIGTYFVRANQQGGGAHVANAAYATAPDTRGRGVARAMCAHSLEHARARGFRAMQFNFVVATNERAVRLWQAMGFEVIGRIPAAFTHPTLGDVDALIMHRAL
jgi:ribosomal protein S18 acetylase RimI-like enzyme